MKFIIVIFLSFILSSLFSCVDESESEQLDTFEYNTIKKIRETKTIKAIFLDNNISYFVYKGVAMGFHYDIIKEFSDEMDFKLETFVTKNSDSLVNYLIEDKCDIICSSLKMNIEQSNEIQYTDYHSLTPQVLVQRLPSEYKSMSKNQIEKKLVRYAFDLVGKKVTVKKGSAYHNRLINLNNEIGGGIIINSINEDLNEEELIGKVSAGEIEYTIVDENIAIISSKVYHNLDYSVQMSIINKLSFGIRKDADSLKIYFDKWIQKYRKSSDYRNLYNKYYKNSYSYKKRLESGYLLAKGGKISPYDEIIKLSTKNTFWDWRLIAAVIFHESSFDINAKSYSGAYGLMQLMPSTGDDFGVDSLSTPESQIKAGVKYLNQLNNLWKEKISDSTERVKFILASYNVGVGHILDARVIAKLYNKNPDLWDDNTAWCLKQKSKSEFYNNPNVKFGYCKGSITNRYVDDILNTYEHYKKMLN